jgi:hypothetical protein
MGTSHEDVFTFMTVFHEILLRIRNVLDKGCKKNQNTHFMFSNFFFLNCAMYEIMPKNMAKAEGPQMTSQYGAYELHAGLARLHAHICARKYTQICGIYCFSSATLITNT